jgi:2-oxoisovalerate dehydrogenase E1 component
MTETSDYTWIDLEPDVPDDVLERYQEQIRVALLIRRTELRLLDLFREGKLFGTLHTCIGQEFVGVSVARPLRSEDCVLSNHRGHGHYLARTGDVAGLIAEIMGKATGVCGGRGGSQHLHHGNYYSNGVQGGMVPISVGMAWAQRLRRTAGISLVLIGDGTLGEGAVYESLNIASTQKLPVLFVCENNFIAQSTPRTQSMAGEICQRAAAFSVETAHSSTWQWTALLEDMRRSVERVRETGRPLFHQVDTFRLMAHSKGDDSRPEDYLAHHRRRDPLEAILGRFGGDPRLVDMLARIDATIEEAVHAAEAAPFGQPRVTSQQRTACSWQERTFIEERVHQSVRRGLMEGLKRFPETVLLGEDVESPYGGAFKCTQGLSEEFPGRVTNMPISELSLVGVGNGLALAGMRPVVEIMFGDFLSLAADQWINHAAKFRFMYHDKVAVPLIVRTPMGGKRGYGATHSQSLEKHFCGVPDTRVVCLHHRDNPAELYLRLLEAADLPTLVVENKILYGQMCSCRPPNGFELLFSEGEVFPTARLKPSLEPQVTILALGGMSLEAEAAVLRLFETEEIAAELFLPSQIYPFDARVMSESLEQTRRLVVVEEGQLFASFASEVLAQVAQVFGPRGLACRRVGATPTAIPAARPLEQSCLPDVDAISVAVREVLGERLG